MEMHVKVRKEHHDLCCLSCKRSKILMEVTNKGRKKERIENEFKAVKVIRDCGLGIQLRGSWVARKASRRKG